MARVTVPNNHTVSRGKTGSRIFILIHTHQMIVKRGVQRSLTDQRILEEAPARASQRTQGTPERRDGGVVASPEVNKFPN